MRVCHNRIANPVIILAAVNFDENVAQTLNSAKSEIGRFFSPMLSLWSFALRGERPIIARPRSLLPCFQGIAYTDLSDDTSGKFRRSAHKVDNRLNIPAT
jgi:hypothetical protein